MPSEVKVWGTWAYDYLPQLNTDLLGGEGVGGSEAGDSNVLEQYISRVDFENHPPFSCGFYIKELQTKQYILLEFHNRHNILIPNKEQEYEFRIKNSP